MVPIYFFVTWIRNKMYDLGIKKSKTYNFPVIAVGNLSVGGTGKSPMVEYLIRLLMDKVKVATLSRGYKRETKGFQLVTAFSTVKEVGDEPLQFKSKYEDIVVAVDGDRRNGITNLQKVKPTPEVIILDDAYQHRKVTAGFYILLTSYHDLYCNDIVLPTGNLRESKKGASRADIIIVTKCPVDLSIEERKIIEKKLTIAPNQSLFFAGINYSSEIVNVSSKRSIDAVRDCSFTLVTGIANPKPLVHYYNSLALRFDHINFPDHHNFSKKELEELNTNEFIITTEKDYMRLAPYFSEEKLWYQPIEMKFIEDEISFDNQILEHIKKWDL